jgi:hypothetical protein
MLTTPHYIQARRHRPGFSQADYKEAFMAFPQGAVLQGVQNLEIAGTSTTNSARIDEI